MARTDMTFKQFMVALDKAVSAKIGVSVHELPDMTFRDWYDDELSIEEAVEEVLDAQGLNEFSDEDYDEDFEELNHDKLLAQQEQSDFAGDETPGDYDRFEGAGEY